MGMNMAMNPEFIVLEGDAEIIPWSRFFLQKNTVALLAFETPTYFAEIQLTA
jgi:hypothetical protein